MRKSWLWDALVGLVLTLAVAACYALPQFFPLIEGVELKSYDGRAKLRQSVDVAGEIVLVVIDDNSVAQIGRWPWPRSRIAALIDKLQASRPKAIGLDIVYSEPEQSDGLSAIDGLRQQYDGLLQARRIIDRRKLLDAAFSQARVDLDSDSKLLACLRQAGNVVLPMFFADGMIGARSEPLPAALSSSTIHARQDPGATVLTALQDVRAVYPLDIFARAAQAVGHVNLEPDRDGVLRREALVERYGDAYVPSFALQLAAAYRGIKLADVTLVPGRVVMLGPSAVPLDEDSRMLVTFYGPAGTFHSVSYQDVMNDKVSPDLFKDKIVLVGPTATAVSTLSATPVGRNVSSLEIVANALENLLQGKFMTRPPWAKNLELGLIAFIGLFIMLALPRLRALWGFFVSLLLLAMLFGAGTYLFVNGQWLKVAYPAVLLAAGYVVLISKRFFVTGRGKELVEAPAVEADKMPGLSFQGQGMKEAAEGKRNGTMLIGRTAKPTLGRYEIEKELGRGAMGIVYRGKDPKINRQVAIKTMILDEGSNAAEGKAVKERFFREAESAGTLNHPNIVRIFDAGEEQDVAYIAMELLDGQDFTRFTLKDALLPPLKAMEYVATVADALDYAHARGIVHRDIKPANLMLLKDGTVRVADFGIARITASSKNATGAVMGTPSYMSPEQVAGKKVDGRSDIFSLCVALFELLTGEKPFKGGEEMGTLLFQIANDPHPDILALRPELPSCVAAIIDKGLAKDPGRRYASGAALSADIRACLAAAASKDTVSLEAPVMLAAAKADSSRAAEITLPSITDAEKTVQFKAGGGA